MSIQSSSSFSLRPEADRIVVLPVYGGHGLDFGIQPSREDHLVQKQILAEMLHAHITQTGHSAGFAGVNDLASVTLVDFRQDYPGLIGKPIVMMRCMPMYFAEVDPQSWVIHYRDMDTRLQVARQSGLLFMGRNEAIAVVLGPQSDVGNQIVKAFLTDEYGVPRPIHGIYPGDRRITGSQRQIADLHVHQAEQALRDTMADLAMETGRGEDGASERRIQLLKQTVRLLEAHIPHAQPERTASGSVIRRSFKEGGKGAIAPMTKASEGWEHYPTSQDAWYYGVMVNFERREIISYTEGDIAHVQCVDERTFRAELQSMAEFHGRSRARSASAYGGDGSVIHFYDSLFHPGNAERKVVSLRNQADAPSSVPVFVAVDLTHPIFSRLNESDELIVPADAFEVDLLDSLAYVTHHLRALRTSNGIAFILDFEGGDQRFGQIDR